MEQGFDHDHKRDLYGARTVLSGFSGYVWRTDHVMIMVAVCKVQLL